jgi:hypothetical protein
LTLGNRLRFLQMRNCSGVQVAVLVSFPDGDLELGVNSQVELTKDTRGTKGQVI